VISKLKRRKRRLKKTRAKIKQLKVNRLSVYRSSNHIYAQITSPLDNTVIVSASTLEADVKTSLKDNSTGNINAAKIVGESIAKKAKKAKVKVVAFDRSGYLYHGRIKALAESARENGLQF
jgi:large subunit ribosomal protein L18